MKVLVDTSVWSFALCRRSPTHHAVDELRRLVGHGRAALVGPIRQEILSGIRDDAAFAALRDRLDAFPDEPVLKGDYVRAAECFNLCRASGIQGSNTDFLICAVAERNHFPIFTTDDDFARFSHFVPVALHRY
jgi:predicted nucleic acid-binding protein